MRAKNLLWRAWSKTLVMTVLACSPATSVFPQPATNETTTLPPVTVVAQKEPQLEQKLPVSLTAVTLETLQEANIHTIKEASIFAPNIFINEFTARAVQNPFFRGIGGSPLNPGVTTFVDGVPQLNSYSANIELVDVNQVEFVRGPQGALFGRNTAAGVINILSARPSGTWTGSVEGSYGNFDFRDVRGQVGGPISDSMAFSLAGGYSARDGYTENDFTGNDIDDREAGFGKGQFLFNPSERVELRLIVSGEHDDDGDYALGDLGSIRANPHHVSRDFEGFNRRDVVAGTLLANYFGEAIDIASISGGVWWKNHGLTDLDFSPVPGNTRDNEEEQRQYTQEFRFSSAKDKPLHLADSLGMSWQAGVFAFKQDYEQEILNTAIFPNPVPPPAFFPVNNTTTADLDDWGVGVYGQARLMAWDKLEFVAGLRYDFEDKSAELTSETQPPVVPSSQSDLEDDFSQVSPQFSIGYHYNDEQMTYAATARGFRAGGFNQTSPPGSEKYDTEDTWNYEIGHKSIWCDGRLETTLALFYIDWNDLQLNEPVPGSGGTSFFIENAGEATSKGVEFATKWRPVGWCDLFGSVGYTDAKFRSGSVSQGAGVGGNRLPFAPEITGNAGAQLSWAPCSAATLYLRGQVVVYGEFEYDPSNVESQDTYSLADFRGGIRGQNWFVEGWVNNAFDTEYVPIAIPFSSPSGYVGESGAPLTYGVRAGLHF